MRRATDDQILRSRSGLTFYVPPIVEPDEEAEARALKEQLREQDGGHGCKSAAAATVPTGRVQPAARDAEQQRAVVDPFEGDLLAGFSVVDGIHQERPVMRQEQAHVDPYAWEYSVI